MDSTRLSSIEGERRVSFSGERMAEAEQQPVAGQDAHPQAPPNPLDLLQWALGAIRQLQGWVQRQGRCDGCGVVVDLTHPKIEKRAGPPIVTPEGTKQKLEILCGRCAHRGRLVGVPS